MKAFLNTLLAYDAPVYKTISNLTTAPGEVIRSYIKGKRKSYYNPFRYLVFSMALYLLVKVLIDFDPVATYNTMMGVEAPSNAPVNSPIGSGQFFSRNINIFIFILSFVLAIVTKLLFWKEGVKLAEYLVLGFYSVGHYMLFGSIIILFTLISPKLYILNYLIVLIYFPFLLITFHKKGHVIWKSTKAIATIFVSYFLFAFIGFAISDFILTTF